MKQQATNVLFFGYWNQDSDDLSDKSGQADLRDNYPPLSHPGSPTAPTTESAAAETSSSSNSSWIGLPDVCPTA